MNLLSFSQYYGMQKSQKQLFFCFLTNVKQKHNFFFDVKKNNKYRYEVSESQKKKYQKS